MHPATAGESSGGGATSRRTLTARRIAEIAGGRVVGDGEAVVWGVAPIDRAEGGHLTFLASAKYAPMLQGCGASILLVSPSLAETAGDVAARIVVEKPQEAMLRLLPELFQPVARTPRVDPTARLGRGVRLGRDVVIGAYVVVGDGAVLGDRVCLEPHAVVGDGVEIGDDSHIYSHVTLYSGAIIGQRVIVHAGARIASDGFGYVFSGGAHQKIPHVGRCVLEDDVEIGANTTIDRGSIDDTVVGAGTKIDNLVQVGHNVRIGRLCLLVSQAGIAGSARIGDGCVIGGQVGVSGHLSIGNGAKVAAQAGVFGDVPAGETWSGYPARPHSVALRAQAALFKLAGMMRHLERVVNVPKPTADGGEGERR